MFLLTVLGALLLLFLLLGGGLALFWKAKRKTIVRRTGIAYLLAVPLLLLGVAPFLIARFVVRAGTRPPDLKLKDTPADFGIPFEEVQLEAADGLRLRGWWIAPTQKNAVVLLSHGLFRTRIEMLSRAVALAKTGYGALLYDSRNHGASQKGLVSLGFYETQDVLGGMAYIQRRCGSSGSPPVKTVLMGVSMGAVATLRAAGETSGYAALILDSPFASIRETITDHSWLFFKLPRFTFPPLFLFWFQRLAGFDVDQVNSHTALARVQPVPMLMITSEGDRRMRAEVARQLFDESRSPVKKIEVFGRDVGHGAAARLHPKEYAALLAGFLEQTLR
ncbi:MAG: alpha/beta hydrolase [Acidobacteria bacterium]|nr:alpha/beta hydrolase [Acidobacteriota bacterium]MCI0620340.1 alpha/beta hydrolase [Acidobacteriota bacterium]MCI0723185.1 alpha/beta hydrolase [Acidobacteriota bacterium]